MTQGFRLIDKVLSFNKGQHITTLAETKGTTRLFGEFGTEFALLEIAAQTCGLAHRLSDMDSDCFLAKVKWCCFTKVKSEPLQVRTVAELTGSSPGLLSFQVHQVDSTATLAKYQLLMAVMLDIGGDKVKRVEYWRNHLQALLRDQ